MHFEIRARLGLTESLRASVERRMKFALGRFAARISGVTVRLFDANGPRGGVDKVCRVQVAMAGGPPVRVEEYDADLYAAIARAADRAGRAVARDVTRRREAGSARLRRLATRAKRAVRG